MKRRNSIPNARGAMLVQVALSIVVLMSFAVFVVDYGALLLARGEAQNAADAGALAGAISRAYDEFANPPSAGGPVEQAARGIAARHSVSRDLIPPATVGVSYPCPPGVTGGGCVQVDIYRNGENGSASLPVFFGPLLGVNTQGVRATATAQAVAANAVNCLKPWVVVDRWSDAQQNPWTQASIYNPNQGDSYIAPYGGAATTGFSNRDAAGNPVDWGYQMALKLPHPGSQNAAEGQWGAGWAMAVSLPNDESGGGGPYQRNITGCTSATVGIAPQGEQCGGANPSVGCLQVEPGAMVGPTRTGAEEIVGLDGGASWDRTANNGRGGIIGTQGAPSPRIIPIAVVDPHHYVTQPNTNGRNGIVKVVNILGFFLEGVCPQGGGQGNEPSFSLESYFNGTGACEPDTVAGRLVTFPGVFAPGAAAPGPGAFGQVIRLVR